MEPAGDHGGRVARTDHAGQDVLDLLAAKFGEMEVDDATTSSPRCSACYRRP
jgi:hypothetical protein